MSELPVEKTEQAPAPVKAKSVRRRITEAEEKFFENWVPYLVGGMMAGGFAGGFLTNGLETWLINEVGKVDLYPILNPSSGGITHIKWPFWWLLHYIFSCMTGGMLMGLGVCAFWAWVSTPEENTKSPVNPDPVTKAEQDLALAKENLGKLEDLCADTTKRTAALEAERDSYRLTVPALEARCNQIRAETILRTTSPNLQRLQKEYNLQSPELLPSSAPPGDGQEPTPIN